MPVACAEALEPRRLFSGGFSQDGFAKAITNPYMPFLPGTEYVYQGTKNGVAETDHIVVTHQTRKVFGVQTTVVLDTVFVGGKLAEKTTDWYAQDAAGNVWYFGEDSKEYENGKPSAAGSWLAGVRGAEPGIVMPAHPAVGDAYLQEHAKGVAEDRAQVLSTSAHVTTPFATFGACVETKDFSLIEPGNVEHKFFKAGIGFVKSQTIQGEPETLELVKFIP